MAKKRSKLVIGKKPVKGGVGSAIKGAAIGAGAGAGITLLVQFLLDWLFGDKKTPNMELQSRLAMLMAGGGKVAVPAIPIRVPTPDLRPGGPKLDYPTGGWGDVSDWDPTYTPERSAAWQARGPGQLEWAIEHTGPGTSEVPGEQYY